MTVRAARCANTLLVQMSIIAACSDATPPAASPLVFNAEENRLNVYDPTGTARDSNGQIPTSDDAAGGCGRTDATGAPVADHGQKDVFIKSDTNLPTPNAIVASPVGTFYVSSVTKGVMDTGLDFPDGIGVLQ